MFEILVQFHKIEISLMTFVDFNSHTMFMYIIFFAIFVPFHKVEISIHVCDACLDFKTQMGFLFARQMSKQLLLTINSNFVNHIVKYKYKRVNISH